MSSLLDKLDNPLFRAYIGFPNKIPRVYVEDNLIWYNTNETELSREQIWTLIDEKIFSPVKIRVSKENTIELGY